MSAPRTASLRRETLRTALYCFVAFILLQGAIIIGYNSYRQEETRGTLRTVIATKAEALEQLDENLHIFGDYLSVHAAVANMFTTSGMHNVENDMLDTAFDLARLMTQTSANIDDVLFINMQGIGRSYATGLGSNLIDLVRVQYQYDDEKRQDTAYFFFPDYPFEHDAQFAYVTPILRVNVSNPVAEKVGTIILACRSDYIAQLFRLDTAQEYTVQLRDAQGNSVYAYPEKEIEIPGHHVREVRAVSGMPLTIELSMAPIAAPMGGFFLQMLLGGILLFAITLLLSFRMIQRDVLRPVEQMVGQMIAVRQPQSREHLTRTHIQELDIIVDSANRMIDSLADSTEQQLKTQSELLEARLRRNEMELYALQSQINPHFLFNTLQCIRALSLDYGAKDVADISTAMARLMRYAIQSGDTVRISEEIGIIEQYLRIIDIRYEGRIAHTIDVPQEIREMLCIRMMIQPLVENAVVHGLDQQEKGGTLRIHAHKEEKNIILDIWDDGVGFSEERLARIREELSLGFHDAISRAGLQSFGLYNINRRMKLAFGEEYGVEIHSLPGDTRLRLRIPVRYP